MVQKPRRNRTSKETAKEKIAVSRPKDPSGSRFGALSELREDGIQENGKHEEITRAELAAKITGKSGVGIYPKGSERLDGIEKQKKSDEKVSKQGNQSLGNKKKKGMSQLTLALETRKDTVRIPQKDKMDVEESTCVPDTPLEIQMGYLSSNGPETSGINSVRQRIELKTKCRKNVDEADPPLSNYNKEQLGLDDLIHNEVDRSVSNRPNLDLMVDKGKEVKPMALDKNEVQTDLEGQ